MNAFKLALAQMPVIGGRKEENMCCAIHFIAEAAKLRAAVVLLPEALDCGWCHESGRVDGGAIPDGDACLRLREAARIHRLYVCAGLIERAGDQLFNSAVLISPEGKILLHHRKLDELTLAHHLYAQGDRLAVVHTPLGTLGLMVCADAFVPGQLVSRTLGLMGAQIILSPCAWAVPPDHDNTRTPYGQLWIDSYGPVARDFQLWIAGASNVGCLSDGEWSGYKCIGCSLVMNPAGQPALQGPFGVEAAALLCVEVTLTLRPGRAEPR